MKTKLLGTALALGLVMSPLASFAGGVGGGNANSNWTIYGWQNWALDFRSTDTKSSKTDADGNALDRDRDLIKMENEAANIGFAASIDTGMSMGGVPIKANFQCEQFTTFNRLAAFHHNGWCNRNSKLGLSGPWGEVMAAGWLTPYNEVTAQSIDPFYDAGSHTHSTLLGLVGFGTQYGNSGFDGALGYGTGVGGQGFMRRKANMWQWFSPASWGGLHVRVGWSNQHIWATDETEVTTNIVTEHELTYGTNEALNDAKTGTWGERGDDDYSHTPSAYISKFSSAKLTGADKEALDTYTAAIKAAENAYGMTTENRISKADLKQAEETRRTAIEAAEAALIGKISQGFKDEVDMALSAATTPTKHKIAEVDPQILSIGASYTANVGNGNELWLAIGYQRHDEWAAADSNLQCEDSDDETIRYAVKYTHDWGNGHTTRISAAYEEMEYDWEHCGGTTGAGPFDFAKTGGMVDFERDAWLISGKHDFPGPLDFRFMYMEADDFECGSSMKTYTMNGAGERVMDTDCAGISESDSGAEAFSVGMYYTFPAGTELRLVYGEVDNDSNSQNDFGINGDSIRMGGKNESWQIGMVQWF